MNEIYGWVRNITYYLIAITVITNILPDKKYEKYLKLFTGMVLILLVLKPVTGGLRLEDKIAYYFESITFQEEADDLKKELLGMEDKRLENMKKRYEGAVAMDVREMVKSAGFYPKQTKVSIDGDMESTKFGTVTQIFQSISTQEPEEMRSTIPIDPIQEIEAIDTNPKQLDQDENKEKRQARQEEDTELNTLKNKIADYYDLEVGYVEIQWEDE